MILTVVMILIHLLGLNLEVGQLEEGTWRETKGREMGGEWSILRVTRYLIDRIANLLLFLVRMGHHLLIDLRNLINRYLPNHSK